MPVLVFLASCATGPRLELAPGEGIPAGEALVLGRLEVLDGTAQVIGSPGTAAPANGWGAFDVVVASEAEGDERSQRLTDGLIRWHLPAGKYGIWGFARRAKAGQTSGSLGATFEVPEGASAVYVGTLRIRFGEGVGQTHASVQGPVALGVIPFLMTIASMREMPKLLAPFSLNVIDQLDDELRAARPFVPRGAVVTRSILRLPMDGVTSDPRLAATGDDGEGTLFRIVRPIRPKDVPTFLWQKVESLEPTLEWERQPGVDPAGLTYDLRISRVTCPDNVCTWGRVEYYRTHLQEAHHRVETPLMPSTFHYWEVRLRRGDVVGPWSAYEIVTMDRTDNGPAAPRHVDPNSVPTKRGAFGFQTPAR